MSVSSALIVGGGITGSVLALALAQRGVSVDLAEISPQWHGVGHGITVQAGIVFGFDGDDESTFEATLRGATRVGLDGATVSILTPFPQTPVFEDLKRTGRLLTADWSYYNGNAYTNCRGCRHNHNYSHTIYLNHHAQGYHYHSN